METTLVKLSKIDGSGSTQTRHKLCQATINEYSLLIENGHEFPPIELYEGEGGKLWIGDGWHRYYAHSLAGRDGIEAEVQPGGEEAALVAALGANARHGLRRTNEDKRKAIMMALERFTDRSDRVIAEMTATGNSTVGRIRREMEESGEIEPTTERTGQDGVNQPMVLQCNTISTPADTVCLTDPIPSEERNPDTLGDPAPTWEQALSNDDPHLCGVPIDPETQGVSRSLAKEAIRSIKGEEYFRSIFRTRNASLEHTERLEEKAEAKKRIESGISRTVVALNAFERQTAAQQTATLALITKDALDQECQLFAARVVGYTKVPDWEAEIPDMEPVLAIRLLAAFLVSRATVMLGGENKHVRALEGER